MASAGGLAAQIPARFGIRAPIRTFALSAREHREWTESFHGGWCEAAAPILASPAPAISLDLSSGFPLIAHLIGWWDLLCAESVRRHTVTADLRKLCGQVVDDPRVVLNRSVWRRFGCTLVEVVPNGEIWPIELEDDQRPDGRLEFVPVRSPHRSMFYAWPDVVAAAVRSGRIPTIVWATTYEAVRRQQTLRERLPALAGLLLTVDTDPVLNLVAHRQASRARGERTHPALLRAVVNALVFGNLCRFDGIRVQRDGSWTTAEKPGPWNCMPIASTVTAGSHLLLAVLDRLVTDLGGLVVYRDTDSSIVPASPEGGEVSLPDGTSVRLLSWDDLDGVIGLFDSISPGPEWLTWKSVTGSGSDPLHSLVLGPKRHTEFQTGHQA